MRYPLQAFALLAATVTMAEPSASQVQDFWLNQAVVFHSKSKFEVRLTEQGSQWLWSYNKAIGATKGAVLPTFAGGQTAIDQWIDVKIAHDRWLAAKQAATANGLEFDAAEPDLPGPTPERIATLVGEAPNFAEATRPETTKIVFPDELSVQLTDHVEVRPRYAFFRHANGSRFIGPRAKTLGTQKLHELCREAGVTPSEFRIMQAVSLLEGGFASLNTYDTGYVSVGILQFASLNAGKGSLLSVLKEEKSQSPESFEKDFQQYGIDVNARGELSALDPQSGEMIAGTEAIERIIDDKRLSSIFCHAGLASDEFRIAQLRIAKKLYFPADDLVALKQQGQTFKVRLGDIFRSEAGMATLLDRKVNVGNLSLLKRVLQQCADQTGATSADDLSVHERDLIAKVKYRKDFTKESTLTQPGEAVAENEAVSTTDSTH